jgi:predicted MFS family arabinose efflux permease
VVGYLYGVNTLGAAVGAFTTAWVLLRHFGFEDILHIGATLNALAAVGALFVWSRLRSRNTIAVPVPHTASEEVEPAPFRCG